MGAFHLPVTLSTVVLVMAAQGGGRIIPLAPASTGLRLAMLSYGFVEVTDQAVDIAAITTFTFGVGAVLMLAGLVIALTIIAREFGTLSPRRALAPRATAIGAALARAYLIRTGVADGHARVQVDHVGDVHADAAVRRARPDRPVLGGAVDADAVGDAQPARLERVVRRAAGDHLARRATRPTALLGTCQAGVTCLFWMR